MPIRIITGDCKEALANMAAECVHCVVTSPPYWGLRDYGVDGQLGLESSPDEYIAGMVEVFREVRRVLRDDGTVWLNVGDSYATGGGAVGRCPGGGEQGKRFLRQGHINTQPNRMPQVGLKPKDLCMIPARLALALQSDGWWLRSEIVWSKPNPMPESVTDRPTSAHEKIFLLAKSQRYFFDADAVRTPAAASSISRWNQNIDAQSGSSRANGGAKTNGPMKAVGGVPRQRPNGASTDTFIPGENTCGVPTMGANIRNVWTVATQPFSEAHFATFPPALIEPCIKAGTSEKGCCSGCGAPWVRQTERTPMVIKRSERTHSMGQTRASGTVVSPASSETTGWSPSCTCADDPIPCTVLDPFGGAGTTGLVADRIGRNAILIELNPEYAEMAQRRIENDAGLFAEVTA